MIADDELLLRDGLAQLLEEAGIDVVGKVGTADELRRKVELTHPDVAIVDIRMPPSHTDEGLVVAQELKATYPELGVLLLSHYLDSRYAMHLIEEHTSGCGYLLKERLSDLAILIDTLTRLRDGECVVDPTIIARLVSRARENSPLADLTQRETEVLTLIAEGRSNKGISERLFLSPKTVEGHVKHVFQKLGIDDSPADHRRVLAALVYLRARATRPDRG